MKTYKAKVMLLACLVAAAIIVRLSGAGRYLTFENFVEHRDIFQHYVHTHYVSSVGGFILLYIIVAALSIPGSAVLSISGRFLFGVVFGIIYTNVGATIGSICIFLITRYLLGNWLQVKYSKELRTFNEEMERHGSNYLLTLRFIPAFPFFLVNIFAGLTRLPFRTFVWTTLVGILPGDAVYTFAGSQLGTIRSVKDVFSANMFAALTLLAIMSMLPVIYKRLRRVR